MNRSIFTFVVAWACLLAASCTTPHHQELVDAGGDSGISEVSTDAGHGHLFGAFAPSGTGFDFRVDGGLQPVAAGPAAPAPTATNQVLSFCDGGAGTPTACWLGITQDFINALPAAFSPTLALASGGGTIEVGASCSPTFNANPATNAGTVTNCLIADNQGHSASSISQANAINVDSPGGPHGYSLSSPGTVTVTVTETLIATSTTKSVGAIGCTFDYRWFSGKDSHSGGNAITASSTNATLGGGGATATLTGSLAASFIGVSFSTSPSNEYVYMAFPHSGSAHTFHDQNGFVFAASVVVTSFSYTTVTGVTGVAYDIYRSDNLLNTSYTVTVVSMLEPPWLDAEPANDVDDGRGAMPKSEAA